MAQIRPVMHVYNLDGKRMDGAVVSPGVFNAPLRCDLVQSVFARIDKNDRQAYCVNIHAGEQTSAYSWGTGRAVARVPRVNGGGTHRCGQAAFANFCRGGRMFAPTKRWRRWHRKVNLTERRHAVATAIAATGVPALLEARGHRISGVPECPLVVDDALGQVKETKRLVQILTRLGCGDDLAKVVDSKKVRVGHGKARNRKRVQRSGPLIIHRGDQDLVRSAGNIPGVEICDVEDLRLKMLAPGGQVGRLCVYTKSAFQYLSKLYGRVHIAGGKANAVSPLKNGYRVQYPMLTNPDISKIINSDAIQSVVKRPKTSCVRRTQHKNLISNRAVLCRVNPAAKILKARARREMTPGTPEFKNKVKRVIARRAEGKKARKGCKDYYSHIFKDIDAKNLADREARREEKLALLAATG